MLFNSPLYIFAFLPSVFLGYFLFQRLNWITSGKIWLVASSLYFYAYWNPKYLTLIAISIVFNFSVGWGLHRTKKLTNHSGKHLTILSLGIIFNLGLLGYFKYADFFLSNINALFGAEFSLLHLVLPLAISFFTFQQIAYLVDCYKFDTQEYDFLSYCLFVSFFPQLIAGPIVHHAEMMPQFANRSNRYLEWNNVAKGILIFGIGLFKKVVIADTLAIWANAGYAEPGNLNLYESWATSLSYTFQLYYDFSGYTDMAIGAALIFNIRLPLNFNSPYKASSIQDFWRRWHMTLSRWLRDYVYIPLGGNRSSNIRTYFNLLITFVLGGLWHGAGWTFVLWGVLHGIALCVHRLWGSTRIRLPNLLSWALTFIFVHLAWIFFRAENIPTALTLIKGMVGLNGLGNTPTDWNSISATHDNWSTIASSGNLAFILLFAAIAFLSRNSIELVIDRSQYHIGHALLVACALISSVLLSIASRTPEFLYFNF